jgi:hypothetical protein
MTSPTSAPYEKTVTLPTELVTAAHNALIWIGSPGTQPRKGFRNWCRQIAQKLDKYLDQAGVQEELF